MDELAGARSDYELKVWPVTKDGKETFSAMAQCPAYVDQEQGFESVESALEWASDRARDSGDPMAPYED